MITLENDLLQGNSFMVISKSVKKAPADPRKRRLFRNRVIRFYEKEGRDQFSWRQTRDPWKILLAEMLLRKTTAAQVDSVYSSISRLSPKELSKKTQEELENLLRPLGIQNERSRLLRAVSKALSTRDYSAFRDEEFLKSLPGVGRYAVNAVMCFAFGEPRPALDRNMIRVIGRVFSIKSNRSRPHTDPELWRTAEQLVSRSKPREYNWGILDLAALICRPRNPKCIKCPLKDICDFGITVVSSEPEINNV